MTSDYDVGEIAELSRCSEDLVRKVRRAMRFPHEREQFRIALSQVRQEVRELRATVAMLSAALEVIQSALQKESTDFSYTNIRPETSRAATAHTP